MSTIEWTNETWNPTTGCDRVSPGCDNCYALTMARRLKGMGSAKYQRDGDPKTSGPGFGLTVHHDTLNDPFKWRKPRKVFVNSMSDLFHDGVSDEFIAKVFAVMAATPQHTYQVLTKRHGRMRSLLAGAPDNGFHESMSAQMARLSKVGGIVQWPLPNVWLGVSVEDQQWADIRVPALCRTPAAVRFLSVEPLLESVELGLTDDIHWVIVGGESGTGARPFETDWARGVVSQCRDAGIPVFVKQLGSVIGHSLGGGKGNDWDFWPVDLRVREYPEAAA